MKHELTEGCTCTALFINDIDIYKLPTKDIIEAIHELVDLLIDHREEAIWEWQGLMSTVGNYEDLGHCDTCGDDISKYTVNIE